MKSAKPQDTWDIVIGCGGLNWEWWHDLKTTGDDTDKWTVTITADDGNDGEKTVTINHAAVMKMARYVLANKGKILRKPTTEYRAWSEELERECKNLVFNAEAVDFDACSADELLQLIVLGEVVFV